MKSENRGLKIAIAGKGGVGKTTVAAGLSRLFAEEKRNVIAVDADPDANLGTALGASLEELANITPLADLSELVAERAGSSGGFFSLNPKVDDLPEKLSLDIGGVRLMVLGTVEKGGAGCICPESAMLKALVRHLVIERDDVVVLDMEAGIEHLGRGTAAYVDAFVIVVEPGRRSVQTAGNIIRLAGELGVSNCLLAVNKVRGKDDLSTALEWLPDPTFIGHISDNEAIRAADRAGTVCEDRLFKEEITALKNALLGWMEGGRKGFEINAI